MYLEYYPKKDEPKQYVKAYFPSNEKAKKFAELCTGNNLFLSGKILHSVCVKVNFNPFFIDDLEKNIVAAKKAGLQTLWLTKDMEMADLF